MRRPVAHLAFTLFVCLAALGPVQAATLWTSLGPADTTITAIVIDPVTPTTVYLGTNGAGIYKTGSGGATWQIANTGLDDLAVRTLALDPTGSTTLYAGTASGVFKSTDGGESWHVANGGLPTAPVSALVVDPSAPGTMYVSVRDLGIFKSTDAAETWRAVNSRLSTWDDIKLALDPTPPTRLYAASYFSGLSASADGGDTWQTIPSAVWIHSMTMAPTMPPTLYYATESSFVKSSDGGASWDFVAGGQPSLFWDYPSGGGAIITHEASRWVSVLVVEPGEPPRLYWVDQSPGVSPGFVKTVDGGGTCWMGGLPAQVTTVAPDPSTSPPTLLVGTLGSGLLRVSGCLTLDALTADPATPPPPGTPITFSATASGGTPPYEYKWEVLDRETWTVTTLLDWGPTDKVVWQVPHDGTYRLNVLMRSSGGTAVESSRWLELQVPPPPTPEPHLAVSPTDPKPGETITVYRFCPATTTRNWWALAPVGSPDQTIIGGHRAYVTGTFWSVTMPDAPGMYEVRLFLNDSYERAATSPPIPVPALPQTLSVGAVGTGSVTSSPAGISCGTTCTASFQYSTLVTLTATPASGSIFAGWYDLNCSGNPCIVRMIQARTVFPVFQAAYPLTVAISGSNDGNVSSNAPAGITCGATCVASFISGTTVLLTATPSPGGTFREWRGACAGSSVTCQVGMTATKSVIAVFSKNFTDATLAYGVTIIKTAHVTDMRAAIDTLRVRHSLSPFTWTDATLTAGSTPVKRAHLLDLRTALTQAYQAAGRSLPTYSETTTTAGTTPIRASHLIELRSFVRNLE